MTLDAHVTGIWCGQIGGGGWGWVPLEGSTSYPCRNEIGGILRLCG